MKRIRIGNQITIGWKLRRADIAEDLTIASNMKLVRYVGRQGHVGKQVDFELADNATIRATITPDVADRLGLYIFAFEYDLPNLNNPSGLQPCKADIDAFEIVARTAEADEITHLDYETDLLIGLRGKAFESSDFTVEEWDEIQRPSLEAAALADEATQLANTATAESEEATRQSIASKLLADAATLAANNATAETLQATALTTEATRLSGIATADAIEATRLSVIAKNATIEATRLSDIAKSETIEATRLANLAKDAANAAAQLANDKAFLANEAKSETETATEASIIATGSAITETLRAQEAADRLEAFVPTEIASEIIYNEITF